MSIDQRRAERVDVNVAAEVYTGSGVLEASTRNLSSSGICLDTDVALPEENVIGISIFLTEEGIEDPDEEPLNLKAQVVWCSERDDGGFSAGCRFDDLKEENQQKLNHFLTAVGEA